MEGPPPPRVGVKLRIIPRNAPASGRVTGGRDRSGGVNEVREVRRDQGLRESLSGLRR